MRNISVITDFQKFFAEATNAWLPYILAMNMIAGITMALLQTAKDLFPLRRGFQRSQIRKWFLSGMLRVNAGASDNAKLCSVKGENSLVDLAANGDFRAFFDLQIEQLCSLFNAAIQVVLELPERYPDLVKITASRASAADLTLVGGAAPVPITQGYLDARNRVLHQCQRAIGAFQVGCDFRWKWLMQLAALAISTILSWCALHWGAITTTDSKRMTENSVSLLATSLLAGFLAPVAKDLLAIIQRARGQ